jgi:hypothetical protein
MGGIVGTAASDIAAGAGHVGQTAQAGADVIAGQTGAATLFGSGAGGDVAQPLTMKKNAHIRACCRVKIALLFFISKV